MNSMSQMPPAYLLDRGADAPKIFAWWYRVAAPPAVPPDAPYEAREKLRQGRLASIFLLGEFVILTGVLLGIGLPSGSVSLLLTLLVALLALGVGMLLNRRGLSTAAGSIAVLFVDVAMIVFIATTPGGLTSFALPMFNVLAQPIGIAAFVLPMSYIWTVTVGNCVMVALLVFVLPKSSELKPHMMTVNGLMDVLIRPIATLLITGMGLYFLLYISRKAIERAQRAEVVAQLEHDLAERDRAIASEKQRLDASVQQIEYVHEQIANGNLNARVPLTQDNVLWSVAGKLNMLLSRFQRAIQAEKQLEQHQSQLQWMMREVTRLVQAVHSAKKSGAPVQAQRGGTPVDALILELNGSSVSSGIKSEESSGSLYPIHFRSDFQRKDSR